MAFTDTDRRRFIAAAALTLVALPALWWANTSQNSSAPNLAVAGIDVDAEDTTISTPVDVDPIAPVFLEGPASAAGAGQSEIAVPARPLIDGVSAKATFRSSVWANRCLVPGLSDGSQVTVVNLDNNRSVTCTTVLVPGSPGDVVLTTSAFATIADLTDAPISVEIRR